MLHFGPMWQASKSSGRLTPAADEGEGAGHLADEIIDFIEPRVRGLVAASTPLGPLREHCDARRKAAKSASGALEALSSVLRLDSNVQRAATPPPLP